MVVYVFWDASGLTKRYAFERGSDIANLVFQLVPTCRMMCLLLTVGEVHWALVRKRNEGLINESIFQQATSALRGEVLDNPDFAKLPVDEDLLVRSLDMIERYAVNSVDALVLCAALVANELMGEGESLLFVAADERLLRAAQSEGLMVLNPERADADEAKAQIIAPVGAKEGQKMGQKGMQEGIEKSCQRGGVSRVRKTARVRKHWRILFVASEMFPLAKTGGLADVIGALPKALAKRGHDVRVLMPKYRATFSVDHRTERVVDLPQIRFGNFVLGCGIDESDVLKDDSVIVYLIEHFGLYDRDRLYGYEDDWVRFGLLSKVALELPKAINWKPDIIHCHDWQSGLVAAYLKTLYNGDPFFSDTATVFTIHNLAYQGNFDPSVREALGLPPETFQMHGLEFHGRLSFIKGGLYYANVLTTVSPRYAQEIQTKEFGEGMHGLLRDRAEQGRLVGILNGIDYEVWNPKTDEFLPVRYDTRTFVKGKAANKEALLRWVGLSDGGDMVIGIVSRLAHQKGFDVVIEAADALMKLPIKLVVLGAGEQEPMFAELQKRYPEKVATRLGVVDEELAHLIYAGADAFLMPSRFEPCGLGQMISMRYGTAPIVHAVGGLADTVQDFDPQTKTGNGFAFTELTAANLVAAVERALSVYQDRRLWQTLQRNAMKEDFSWDKSAQGYETLAYSTALQFRRGR